MTSTRRASTTVDCLVQGHHWHATFETGRLLCTACGKKACCPGCTPHSAPMHGVTLVYCADCRLRQNSAAEGRAVEREEVQKP